MSAKSVSHIVCVIQLRLTLVDFHSVSLARTRLGPDKSSRPNKRRGNIVYFDGKKPFKFQWLLHNTVGLGGRKSASHIISLFVSFHQLTQDERGRERDACFFPFVTKITIIIWRLHATLTTEQIAEHGTNIKWRRSQHLVLVRLRLMQIHYVILWLSF